MIGGMPWKQSQVKPENDDMEKIIWDFIERGISEEGDRELHFRFAINFRFSWSNVCKVPETCPGDYD